MKVSTLITYSEISNFFQNSRNKRVSKPVRDVYTCRQIRDTHPRRSDDDSAKTIQLRNEVFSRSQTPSRWDVSVAHSLTPAPGVRFYSANMQANHDISCTRMSSSNEAATAAAAASANVILCVYCSSDDERRTHLELISVTPTAL